MSLVRRGWQGLRRAFFTLAGQDSRSTFAARRRKPRVEQLEARELLAGMPVGMNLEDLVDWSPAWVFKDVFKSSRNWVSHSYNTVTRQTDWAGGANMPVSVDEQGWPTQLATWTNSSGQRMEQRLGTLMFRELNGQYPGGIYRAEWDGTGTITWGMDARAVLTGVTPAGRNFADLQVTPGQGGIYLRIDAINPADPIRNINVWMPDYNGQSFVGDTWQPGEEGTPYHPLFLERLAPFDTIRAIHPMDSIESNIVHWEDSRPADAARQSSAMDAAQNGMAPEYLIELANELDANGWFNMPHMADDDYVRRFATLVRDTLEPDLKAYVEWSNEIWNFAPGFEATFWVRDQTLLPENQGLSHWQIAAREAKRDLDIWSEVFAGQEDRLVRVAGGFAAVPWITNQIALHMQGSFDAIAVAPYMGPNGEQRNAYTAGTTPEQILNDTEASIEYMTARTAEHRAMADGYGQQFGRHIQLLTYEGGPHLDGQNMPYQQAMYDAAQSPRMYDIYQEYLTAMEEAGVELFMHFNFTGRARATQWGDFSALHRMDEPVSTAHRYRALIDYIGEGDTDPPPPPPPANTPPTISDIASRAINEDASTGAIGFTVGDAETAAGSLNVSVVSSNLAVVPAGGMTLGGSGANRTLTVVPAANQFGSATITVTVTDASGATATDSFVLTVNSVNDLPTISNIADRSTTTGMATPAVGFTIGDVETPAASLVLTATSSNASFVPAGNVVFGGSGASRTVTVTPAAGQTGTSTITVSVRDASGATAADSFVLTVTAPTSGTGTGLRGEYFDNSDFTSSRLVRTDPLINFFWGTGAPASGIAPDTFSVRWTGEIEAVEAGSYSFATYSDEGVRVRINGSLVINNWASHAAAWNTSTPVTLSAGQRVPIVVEYYDGSGTALMQLAWRRPGQTQYAVVPRDRLYSAAPPPPPTQQTVTIAATDASAAEASRDPGVFTVTRSGGPLSQPLTVSYATSGTARAGDFDALATSVTIPAGAASTTITVRPIDDTAAEGRESVMLTLAPGSGYTVGTASSATVNVADSDAAALPVLMVIANTDFYYQEYAHTRQELEAAGLRVEVAAATLAPARPHANSGQGTSTGIVTPDLRIADARAANYYSVVFVGGWGSSAYQYAFGGTYSFAPYNGDAATKSRINELITDFVLQDKYITAICHGVSVLAWARVNGTSPLAGRRVSAYAGGAPQSNVAGSTSTRWHIEQNGATMVPSRSIGNPNTAADDVLVDGKIITAENYDSARVYGQALVEYLRG